MVWRCPACTTQIDHKPNEAAPRPGVIYRCSVCRLELVVEEKTQKLTVAPLLTTEPESAAARHLSR